MDIPQNLPKEITDKFQIANNTFSRDVKDNPKDRISVEIGDSKQPDFKPQAKIMRWDNEVNFSLRAEEHPDATVETQGKTIKYITPDYEVHQYELDTGEIGEDGGLEFEWVLPSKPASNVLAATIQTKGLDFFYQPPLTQQEIDEGAVRPENVVGSYAVYHATKGGMNRSDGMEYKVGKAFHIYRPKVTDANNNSVYADLNIDEQNGTLTVTVPQDFLDNAVYPVIVDPTFGYTSIGASENYADFDTSASSSYTSDSTETSIASMTAYVGRKNDVIKMGIYTDASTATLKGNTGDVACTVALGWVTGSMAATLSTSTLYQLALNTGDSADGIAWYFDSGGAQYSYTTIFNYPDFPDPGTWNNFHAASNRISIYATYTAAATTRRYSLTTLGVG